MSRKLTLDDIPDLCAYERGRDALRREIIDLKRGRRIPVGPIVTVVFENRDTMRFQIQEMARAERMLSGEQIQTELDMYNPLIPEPGELTATLFIELGSKDELMEWLPRLVGIERSLELRIGPPKERRAASRRRAPSASRASVARTGFEGRVVKATPDEDHAAQLTREDITASVHYVRFRLDPSLVEAFAKGPVVLAVDDPNYQAETVLSDETRASLVHDLRD